MRGARWWTNANLWDVIRSRMTEPGAVVLAAVKDDRPILMAAGSDEARSRIPERPAQVAREVEVVRIRSRRLFRWWRNRPPYG